MPTARRADLSKVLPAVRCTARKRNGEPCKAMAARGATVCRVHGGSAPQVKATAKRRLDQAAEALTNRLLSFALDQGVSDETALKAVKDALDRAGMAAPKQTDVSVTVRPFEAVLDGLAVDGGSRSDYRRANGLPDPAELPAPTRPGGEATGVRILGETFDGNLVIESHPPAGPHADDEHLAGDVATGDVEKSRRETIGNALTPVRLPHGGYLPAEDAFEQANAANRDFRRNLGRQ